MLEKLKQLLKPPESPIDVDESVLQGNIVQLGVEFPEDFMAYSRVYGSGTISVTAYSWEIYSSFCPKFPKFVNKFFRREDSYRKAMDTDNLDLGLFPEPGGLLPFGHRDDLYFTWKTEGSPDDWKVVVIWLYEESGYEAFSVGFLDFLLNILNGSMKMPGFSSTWNPATDLSFESEVYGI